jgi:hypothetical protein
LAKCGSWTVVVMVEEIIEDLQFVGYPLSLSLLPSKFHRRTDKLTG